MVHRPVLRAREALYTEEEIRLSDTVGNEIPRGNLLSLLNLRASFYKISLPGIVYQTVSFFLFMGKSEAYPISVYSVEYIDEKGYQCGQDGDGNTFRLSVVRDSS